MEANHVLCWDVSVSFPLADSYLQTASASAGAMAELAARRMQGLEVQRAGSPLYIMSIPGESLELMNDDTRQFVADLGQRISSVSGDDRDLFLVSTDFCPFSFQFGSIPHDSFVSDDCAAHASRFLHFLNFFQPHFTRVHCKK